MSYITLESSRQSGKPVELYRFTQGGISVDAGAQPEPAPFGDVVFQENWTYGDTADVYTPATSANWPATNIGNLFGGAPAGGTAGSFTMAGLYFGGGIGSGRGEVYHRHILTGLDPSCVYRIAFRMARNHTTGFLLGGLRVGLLYETHILYASGLDCWLIDYFRPGADGVARIDFGQFDGEFGSFVSDPLDITVYPIVVERQCELSDEEIRPVANRIQTLNYTSADEPIVYKGDTYVPGLIVRDHLRSGQDSIEKAQLEVSIQKDETIAGWFDTTYLTPGPVTCQVLRLHRDDLTDAAIPFTGQVTHAKLEDNVVILTIETDIRKLNKQMPRTYIQRQCNNVLGDSVCQVDLTAFSFTGTVSNIFVDGTELEVLGVGAFVGADLTYFNQGVLVSPTGRRVMIVNVNATTELVQIREAQPDIVAGSTVTLQAGDDGMFATCINRFNNAPRFRGFPFMPLRNPFTGAGLT